METDTLKCRKIEIVDENGKCRICMYGETDKGVIQLMSGDLPMIEISTSNTNPAEIHLTDKNNAVRLTIGMFSNGDVGLTIRDENGSLKAITGYKSESKSGFIRCFGKDKADASDDTEIKKP